VKLLLCSQNPLDVRLGAAKALIELAASLEAIGWQCRLAANTEILPGSRAENTIVATSRFVLAMGRFVEKHAREFDVVDYDQIALPFPRSRFEASTLLVARSGLLNYHLQKARIPRFPGARALAGSVIKGPLRNARRDFHVWLSGHTFASADLINVNNDQDRPTLIAKGFDERKIAVLPLGLTTAQLATFPASAAPAPTVPRVAFIGTFDARKGASDLPRIVRAVTQAVPGCKFRLLGSRYMGEAEVLAFFPKALRGSLEVTPSYTPDQLSVLLRDCSVGIFPSYMEGFGFAVIEMMAASLPVLAYDVPGPAMILGSDWLVPAGAAGELARRTVELLTDPGRLHAARVWARSRANEFTCERAAKSMSEVYSEHVRRLRGRGRKFVRGVN